MKKIILSTMLLITLDCFAGPPVKDASCAKQIRITHPEGSAGVFFDADCKMAYVLPPAASNVSVTQLVGTSNVRQCEVVNRVLAMQESSAKKLEALMDGPATSIPTPGIGGPIDDILKPGAQAEQDISQRTELLKQYLELTKQFQELMNIYRDIPAANAIIRFSVPWDDLVKSYNRSNSATKLTFVKLPLDSAYLTFNRQISKVGSMPAVLDYDIPGVESANASIYESPALSENQKSLLVGNVYSGQILLSLAGACPFYNSLTRTVSGTISGNSISSYLNANLNYTYGLQVYRKYTVSYDLSLLAKHIKERESHGGFFSSGSSTTEINSLDNTDWFNLKNESNDARFSYDLLVPEIKTDLMNRVIREVLMMSGFNPDDAPQVAPRTTTGAKASAEALSKCPDWRCQAGAMTLTVLDSIFGSSESVSTYINQKHAQAGDTVEDNKVLQFYGSSVFNTSGGW